MPHAATTNEIALPLAAVVAGLPQELKAKLIAAPPAGGTIQLPADLVVSQLAFGAVKISFGELRRMAPEIFVNSGGELDNKLVNIPLQEILPRLSPALLACRATRKVEVTDAIVGPFAERGRGFTFTTQSLKGPLAAPAPPASEPTPEPPAAPVPPVAVRQVSPPPLAPMVPPRSIRPATPTNGSNGSNGMSHNHPLAAPTGPSRSVSPPPNGGPGGNGSFGANNHGSGPAPGLPAGLRFGSANGHSHGETAGPGKMQAAPLPAPAQASLPASHPPMSAPPAIAVLLGELCQNWPKDLQNEILGTPLAQSQIPLDGNSLLSGLKRGRVLMFWKQLRLLAQPNSPASPHDPLELELPLKVIAPLFLAAQKNAARPQTKAAVSAEIPDLFFGFPQPAPPAAPVVPVVPPLPKPPEPTPTDTNFYAPGDQHGLPATAEPVQPSRDSSHTDFRNRVAHPREVVACALALPGVAGALVALQDGLRVASQVPVECNADTLAAFLPQILERVNQCTRELRMGPLNNVNFTVGNVPWKIFRVNAVYFAVFGRAGEALPTAQLAQLAAELDRKK